MWLVKAFEIAVNFAKARLRILNCCHRIFTNYAKIDFCSSWQIHVDQFGSLGYLNCAHLPQTMNSFLILTGAKFYTYFKKGNVCCNTSLSCH